MEHEDTWPTQVNLILSDKCQFDIQFCGTITNYISICMQQEDTEFVTTRGRR